MARPSAVTDTVKSKLLERMIEGKSLREICAADDMPSRWAVLRALDGDADFATKYARAREMQADYMDDLILETANAAKSETAAADRVKIDAYKWRASKLRPKVYGDRIDLTSGGERLPAPDETAIAARTAALIQRGLARADGSD